ncbi:hypothetical protein J3F83DRAFT_734192 [Trichoderma novae-zelandiae]
MRRWRGISRRPISFSFPSGRCMVAQSMFLRLLPRVRRPKESCEKGNNIACERIAEAAFFLFPPLPLPLCPSTYVGSFLWSLGWSLCRDHKTKVRNLNIMLQWQHLASRRPNRRPCLSEMPTRAKVVDSSLLLPVRVRGYRPLAWQYFTKCLKFLVAVAVVPYFIYKGIRMAAEGTSEWTSPNRFREACLFLFCSPAEAVCILYIPGPVLRAILQLMLLVA